MGEPEVDPAQAEVEAMATADDIIFFVPEDIRRCTGLRYDVPTFTTTMSRNIAECIRRRLESTEELHPFDPQPNQVADPRFGNDEFAIDFFQPEPPVDGRFIVTITDFDPATLFADIRECIKDCEHKKIEPIARLGYKAGLPGAITKNVVEMVRGPQGRPPPAGPAAAGAPQGGRRKTRKSRRKSKKTSRRR